MSLYAADWSSNKPLPLVTRKDGELILVGMFPWLSLLIASLKPGDVLAIESTFESYLPTKHNEAIDQAALLGVEIVMISPRATANYRKTRGIEKTSDVVDAEIIYIIAHESSYETAKPRRWDIIQEPTLAQQLVTTRKSCYENEAGVRAADRLDRFGLEDSAINKVAAVVAEAVIVMGGGRKDFEKEMGLYAHGYPSQARALFMRDALATQVNRAVGGDGWMKMKGKLGQYPAERKAALKSNRRLMRMIFQKVKADMAGTT
jgi:hypothetical protein